VYDLTGSKAARMAEQEEFVRFATDASRPLFRAAWLLTGDWYLAEDLVQETLAKMYRGWAGADAIDNRLAYAHTVLTRTFLSRRRKRSSGERPSETLPDAPAATADLELRHTLVAALHTLPPRDRAVLVLRYLADRSVEQVARDLGRSPGSVRVQAMRALTKLRAALGADFPELVEH
jgi:RNA polymerase sigma-70 factor (sigma-E family)